MAKIRGFTVESLKVKLVKLPIEDVYKYDKVNNISAVADGVTRDLKNGHAAIKTLIGAIDIYFNYSRPSPAFTAANLFCGISLEVLRDIKEKNPQSIREGFRQANNEIRNYNKDIGITQQTTDYLTKDYAGCVGALTATRTQDGQDILSYGFISDCGVAVFDKNGNLKFKTENQGPEKFDSERDKKVNELLEAYGIFDSTWENQTRRQVIRKYFRNNPSEGYAFGVLTGQENSKVMPYVTTGEYELKPGQKVITYTDGLEPIILTGEFSDELRKKSFEGLEKLCKRKVKTEGSLCLQEVR